MFGGLKIIPLGHQQLTLTTGTVQSCTVPSGANAGVFTIEGASARFRDDGTNPTSSVGMLLAVGQLPLEYQGNLSNLRFIGGAGGCIVNVAYYRTVGG